MRLDEIAEMLVLNGWSRPDLAEKLGKSINTIDRWFCTKESHRRYPSQSDVEKMRAWHAAARESKIQTWQREARDYARKQPTDAHAKQPA
jgi:transposase